MAAEIPPVRPDPRAAASWIVEWLRARGGDVADADLAKNVFESGWIDSLGVVELIADVEQHFGIRFSHGDFQDRRFATIAGLAEIVAERARARSADGSP